MSDFASIEKIIEDARHGKMYILVDSEDGENEGDLIIPGSACTADHINFIWDDVETWWASETVVSAKDKFILNFSHQNSALFTDLKNHFLKIKNT